MNTLSPFSIVCIGELFSKRDCFDRQTTHIQSHVTCEKDIPCLIYQLKILNLKTKMLDEKQIHSDFHIFL